MHIELTNDEALVLCELLSEYGSSDDGRQLAIRHAAERNALWALSAQLERQLVAPFAKDYEQQLLSARSNLEEQRGGW